MDRDYFHWGATAEVMKIVRRREKSPETRRLVEGRLEIARPGTILQSKCAKNNLGPLRPNKRSREEIAEIDSELIQCANRLGGGYQPIQAMEDEPNQIQPDKHFPEEQLNDPENEGESQIIRLDNLPIVDLKKLK